MHARIVGQCFNRGVGEETRRATLNVRGGHDDADGRVAQLVLWNARAQKLDAVKIRKQTGAQRHAQKAMAQLAEWVLQELIQQHQNEHRHQHGHVQFQHRGAFQWQMNVGEVEKEKDEAPDQHVGADRNPGLAPVGLPLVAAQEFHEHVSNVRKLVREHQNRDAGDAQSQPGEFGMMRV